MGLASDYFHKPTETEVDQYFPYKDLTLAR